MNGDELLAWAKRDMVSVTVSGDRLRFAWYGPKPERLLREFALRKAEVLKALGAGLNNGEEHTRGQTPSRPECSSPVLSPAPLRLRPAPEGWPELGEHEVFDLAGFTWETVIPIEGLAHRASPSMAEVRLVRPQGVELPELPHSAVMVQSIERRAGADQPEPAPEVQAPETELSSVEGQTEPRPCQGEEGAILSTKPTTTATALTTKQGRKKQATEAQLSFF